MIVNIWFIKWRVFIRIVYDLLVMSSNPICKLSNFTNTRFSGNWQMDSLCKLLWKENHRHTKTNQTEFELEPTIVIDMILMIFDF